MRVAVSGSTGLIGGHVAHRLAQHHEVVCLGRHNSADQSVDFNQLEMIKALDLTNVAAFVHCAGVVDEDVADNVRQSYWRSSVALEALIERALYFGVKHFVYFSTAHVYGPLVGSINERTVVNPLSDYALAHYVAEQTLKRCVAKQMQCIILRPNAVFGLPVDMTYFDRWWLIPYAFPLAALKLGAITLKSTGEQRRNFVSAQDLAQYVEQCLQQKITDVGTVIINPLGAQHYTVYEFARLCCETLANMKQQVCQVIRPEEVKSVGSTDSDKQVFEYQSHHPEFVSHFGIESYLREFYNRSDTEPVLKALIVKSAD